MSESMDNELDLIAEKVNIGVGRAALLFSRIMDDEVLISAPAIQQLSMSAFGDQLVARLQTTEGSTLSFIGAISGSLMLTFSNAVIPELAARGDGGFLPLVDRVLQECADFSLPKAVPVRFLPNIPLDSAESARSLCRDAEQLFLFEYDFGLSQLYSRGSLGLVLPGSSLPLLARAIFDEFSNGSCP